jgi:hypothetical protein
MFYLLRLPFPATPEIPQGVRMFRLLRLPFPAMPEIPQGVRMFRQQTCVPSFPES